MRVRYVVALLLLAACLVAPALGQGGPYRTPEDAFNAAKAFAEKDDWKGFCGTLTDDSRDMLAGGMVMVGAMIKAFSALAPEDVKAKMAVLDKVMEKHGVTEQAMAKLKDVPPGDGKDPAAIKKFLQAVVSPIKDRTGFVAEMISALKKLDTKGGKDTGPLGKDAKLEDLKVRGDLAKATVVMTQNGKEKREPIEFRKVGEGWKIELPMEDLGKMLGGKKGP